MLRREIQTLFDVAELLGRVVNGVGRPVCVRSSRDTIARVGEGPILMLQMCLGDLVEHLL